METLQDTRWDVVISGTSLPQALLALSLSRSGKRILHLDPNPYYGGDAAAFSLDEAETWAQQHAGSDGEGTFSDAKVTVPAEKTDGEGGLRSSRAYSLTLSPQLIYSRSKIVDAVVSSQVHNHLDFQAVGSWFVLNPRPASFSLTRLVRVPSGREDVFSDTSLDLRAKRALMKFLRFVGTYEDQSEVWEEFKSTSFPEFLEQKFGLPSSSHGPILALTMSEQAPAQTTTEVALPRIARHIRSIGVFGPGFGAVLPKWGGLAEVVQVACRACAVGGGVYVLNKGISSISHKPGSGGEEKETIELELADGGEYVSTKWLVGSSSSLPTTPSQPAETTVTSRSISIISSPLPTLFPPTSEGGPTPAGAVIVIPSSDEKVTEPPVHILAHTSEAGECPMGQCILYASVALPAAEYGFERLDKAIEGLLSSLVHALPASASSSSSPSPPPDPGEAKPEILWKLQYQQRTPLRRAQDADPPSDNNSNNSTIILPPMSQDLVFDDEVLEDVRAAWTKITGDENGGDAEAQTFLAFEARESMGIDDDG